MKTGRIILIILLQYCVDHVIELGLIFVSATLDTIKRVPFTYYHSTIKMWNNFLSNSSYAKKIFTVQNKIIKIWLPKEIEIHVQASLRDRIFNVFQANVHFH